LSASTISPNGMSRSNSASVQHEIAPLLARPAQLGQQPRLPDARLAGDLDQPGLPAGQLIERSLDLG